MSGKGISLGRIAGVDLRLDASWILIVVLLTWTLVAGALPRAAPTAQGLALLMAATSAMLGLCACIFLHASGHAFVARAKGMRVRSITLFAFGGVAEPADEPSDADADAEIRVAAAGPLVSLALAGIACASRLLAGAVGGGALLRAVLGYLALADLILPSSTCCPPFR